MTKGKTGIIRTSVVNFWRNFVYMFIAMGILYLMVIFSLVFMVTTLSQSIATAFTDIAALVHSSSDTSSAAVNEYLAYAFGQIDFDASILEVLRQVLNPAWLRSTIEGFLGVLNENIEGFEASFSSILSDLMNSIKACVGVTIWLCALGVILASYATRFAVRRRSAKRGIKKLIVAHTLVPIVEALLLMLFLFVVSQIKMFGFLLLLVVLVAASASALVSAWLVHRDKDLKLKSVLTWKNVFSQIAASGIILLFDIAIVVVLFFVSPVIAVLVAVPLLIYSMTVADVNADSFVCSLVDSAEGKN